MNLRSELDAKCWRIGRRGYRIVLAPPICLGGVGVSLACVDTPEEDGWQGAAIPPRGGAELDATGPDLETVIDRLLELVEAP